MAASDAQQQTIKISNRQKIKDFSKKSRWEDGVITNDKFLLSIFISSLLTFALSWLLISHEELSNLILILVFGFCLINGVFLFIFPRYIPLAQVVMLLVMLLLGTIFTLREESTFASLCDVLAIIIAWSLLIAVFINFNASNRLEMWFIKPVRLIMVLSVGILLNQILAQNELEILDFFKKDIFKLFYPKDSYLLAVIATLWLSLAVFDLITCVKNRYKSSDLEILIFTMIIVFYKFCRESQYYIFLPESICIKYLDILILYIVCRITIGIFYRLFPFTDNSDEKLFNHGRPLLDISGDELDFAPDAEQTANDILGLRVDRCWRYGIVGKWGSGKSTYVNFILKYLKDKKKETIYFRFSPRSSASVDSIQTDFFRLLSKTLRPYCSSISWLIPRYMQALSLANTYTWLTAIASLWRGNSGEGYKEELSKIISFLPGKLIVVIDDFDRLVCNETMEVLKLIDSNACFDNVVYIVEYDRENVDRILKSGGFENNYIDKYIDVSKAVPYRPLGQYFSEFQKSFNDRLSAVYEKNHPNTLVPKQMKLQFYKPCISKRLKSMRDVNILINTFFADYKYLIGEVNVNQLLLLSVVKAFHVEEYDLLKNYESSKLLVVNNKGCLELTTNAKNKADTVHDILNLLFESLPFAQIHDVREVDVFPIYMGRDLSRGIKAMEGILSKSKEEFIVAIESSEVRSILDKYIDWKVRRDSLASNFDDFRELAQRIVILAVKSDSLTESIKWLVSNGSKTRIQNIMKVDKSKLIELIRDLLFVANSDDMFKLCARILGEEFSPLSPPRGEYRQYISNEITLLSANILEPIKDSEIEKVKSFLKLYKQLEVNNSEMRKAFMSIKDRIYESPSLMIEVLKVKEDSSGALILNMDEEWQNLLLNDLDFATIIRNSTLVLEQRYVQLYLNLAKMADYLKVNKLTKFPCVADNDWLKEIAEDQKKALAIAMEYNIAS